ncbi:MAG: hypothetical protein NVS1B11_36380 [Terriglobales bacterium]
MLILLLILLICFGGIGAYHQRDSAYGGGIGMGTVLLIVLVIYLVFGYGHHLIR